MALWRKRTASSRLHTDPPHWTVHSSRWSPSPSSPNALTSCVWTMRTRTGYRGGNEKPFFIAFHKPFFPRHVTCNKYMSGNISKSNMFSFLIFHLYSCSSNGCVLYKRDIFHLFLHTLSIVVASSHFNNDLNCELVMF